MRTSFQLQETPQHFTAPSCNSLWRAHHGRRSARRESKIRPPVAYSFREITCQKPSSYRSPGKLYDPTSPVFPSNGDRPYKVGVKNLYSLASTFSHSPFNRNYSGNHAGFIDHASLSPACQQNKLTLFSRSKVVVEGYIQTAASFARPDCSWPSCVANPRLA